MKERPKNHGFSLWDGKTSWRRAWPPTPACWPGEFPEWGAWQATVQGVATNQTWPKWLSIQIRLHPSLAESVWKGGCCCCFFFFFFFLYMHPFPWIHNATLSFFVKSWTELLYVLVNSVLSWGWFSFWYLKKTNSNNSVSILWEVQFPSLPPSASLNSPEKMFNGVFRLCQSASN